jgi:hypothetical protein
MKTSRHPLFRFENSQIVFVITCIGRWLAHVFWNWTFLKIILWTTTLIVLFYVEEDWRGARAWAATKAKWEAKGVSFDEQTYIPPPVPDEQNLAAIPLFKLEPDLETGSALEPMALQKALRYNQAGNDIPITGNVLGGESLDIVKIQITIARDYAEVFKNTALPKDTLAQFDALYPFLADLRAASTTRPLCRLSLDYVTQPPALRSLSLLVDQIKVSKILALHAILALADHQPDLALSDLKINFKLMSGIRRNPTLVAGLVNIAMNAIGNDAINYGLELHAWNDVQLAQIQEELARIDFLQNYQFVMRSAPSADTIPNFDLIKTPRSMDFAGWILSSYKLDWILSSFWPDGWIDQNKAKTVEILLSISQTVDPLSHRVFPEQADELENNAKSFERRWDGFAPWNILFSLVTPPVIAATPHFARGQVWGDQIRIACALERYRLAHGIYPSSLDQLVPACVADVPRDVINEQPYHYRLRPDGTYLLYSIGWNQTDDGGKVVYLKDLPKRFDYTQGDWVWPIPQLLPQK